MVAPEKRSGSIKTVIVSFQIPCHGPMSLFKLTRAITNITGACPSISVPHYMTILLSDVEISPRTRSVGRTNRTTA